MSGPTDLGAPVPSGRLFGGHSATDGALVGGLGVIFGGALVMLGAWVPWLTMFAGQQRYGGLIGLYGRLLFVGGALAVLAGFGHVRRDGRALRRCTALLGLVLLAFTTWLLAGLLGMVRSGLDAMLVARPGPGLFLALLGALLVTGIPFVAYLQPRVRELKTTGIR